VSSADADLLVSVVAALKVVRGPDHRGEYVCWCLFHADGNGTPPHEANLRVSERGFICHACGENGSLKRLAERLNVGVPSTVVALEKIYDYTDADGTLLYQVVRKPGKKFRQRRPDGKGGWIWNLQTVRRVPYRLRDLRERPEETVFVVEGEKDADRLHAAGLLATTNAGGAGKWQDEYSAEMERHEVVVLRDNDPAGHRHGEQVAHSVFGKATQLKVVDLPGLKPKGDVSDWLSAGHEVAELLAVIARTPEWRPGGSVGDSAAGEPEERDGAQADRLIRVALDAGIRLVHDARGEPFAQVPVGDHKEIWSCRSRGFKRWLARQFWASEKKAPRSDAVSSALLVLEAQARFDGEECVLNNRVALHEGAIWYDLADAKWRAVRVTPDGWSVVADAPILFRRFAHQRPQVEPIRGGDLARLLDFFNVADRGERRLVEVYPVSALVPGIPHPVPILHGPQGAAKTTLVRMLRRLIDPSLTETLSPPRDATELVQQLAHHWAAFYDNLTSIPDWFSDVLCRAVTGEGFSKRELYSDDDDVIYQFRRCVALNGINIAAHKADLLDRSLLWSLETIPEDRRRPEEELWEAFEQERPRLFGAMLDALARAMSLQASVQLAAYPRMADFARWGVAIAQALGHEPGEFLAAFDANIVTRNDEVIAGSPVAAAVVAFMREREEWEGTATELLTSLEPVATALRVDIRSRSWPKVAHVLSRRLNEVRPNLAAGGVGVELHSGSDRRLRLSHCDRRGALSVAHLSAPAPDLWRTDADDAIPDRMTLPLRIASAPKAAPGGLFDATDAIDGVFPTSQLRDDYDP